MKSFALKFCLIYSTLLKIVLVVNGLVADDCKSLPSYSALKDALINATYPHNSNGGLEFDMWGAIVTKSGIVCQVVYTGSDFSSQYLVSRVVSMQKANTANSLSLDRFALSTANLYSAVQPGGTLYGLQESNPINFAVYDGNSKHFGTTKDPAIGKRCGGINIFGGGLALYMGNEKIGGLGVSGDTSCADHNIAWRVRKMLKLDGNLAKGGTGGLVGGESDAMILDRDAVAIDASGVAKASLSGWGHPICSQDSRRIGKAIGAVVDSI